MIVTQAQARIWNYMQGMAPVGQPFRYNSHDVEADLGMTTDNVTGHLRWLADRGVIRRIDRWTLQVLLPLQAWGIGIRYQTGEKIIMETGVHEIPPSPRYQVRGRKSGPKPARKPIRFAGYDPREGARV